MREADIVFAGTVTKVGAVALSEVPASSRMVVVRVDQVLEKPDAVSLNPGDMVTVEMLKAGTLQQGAHATFYATGWIFGKGVAVREVGHELVKMQLAGGGPVQQESVAHARRQVRDADLRARIRAAAIVAVGRVAEVRPAAFTSAAVRQKRISEHDPDWQEAVIEVQEGLKGTSSGQRVVVRFPGSYDVAWVGAPRFTVGQEGTFLLNKDTATGSPLTMMGGQSVSSFTALEPSNVLSKQDVSRVREVMRSKP